MRYEWDEAKNRRNQRKHDGISFELATLAFEDERCLAGLDRIDETGEQAGMRLARFISSPRPPLRCWLFMHTERTAMAKKSSASSQPAGLKSMRSEDIRNRQWTENERRALRRAARRQIAGDESRITFADIPRLTAEQLASVVRLRAVRRKVAVSVRLDPRVLDWLKSKGEGHLTRINDILTNLMEAERRTGIGR